MAQHTPQWKLDMARLKAENARLREALVEIFKLADNGRDSLDTHHRVMGTANRALLEQAGAS